MTTPAARYVTVGSVAVVAGIAAVVSYSHMQQLAERAGEEWRSWLLPLSIDGLVVAASMVLVTRRRAGLPGGVLAWLALGAGVLASLAANIADARPDVTARLVAGWPALAFAVALELLLQQRRAERDQEAGELAPVPLPAPELVEPVAPDVVDEFMPADMPALAPVVRQPAITLADRVRPLVAEGLGRTSIAKRLGIKPHQARAAIDAIKQEAAA